MVVDRNMTSYINLYDILCYHVTNVLHLDQPIIRLHFSSTALMIQSENGMNSSVCTFWWLIKTVCIHLCGHGGG